MPHSVFFVFVESPNEFASFLLEQTSETIKKGDSDYGLRWLVLTGKHSFLYLAKCFFIAVALYGAYFLVVRRNCFSCKKRWQLMVLAMLSMVIFLYVWTYVRLVFMFPYK